jgi:hypothetical protein
VIAYHLPLLLLGLVLGTVGCGTRTLREHVVTTDTVSVTLRSTKQGGGLVLRGFEHPALIAPVRLSHILAYVDVEIGQADERRRVAAIPPELIYEMGDALSQGLEKADPNQEVVVQALRMERRFGLFSTRYLTSLAAHVKGGQLAVQLGHVDWEVPKYGHEVGEDLPEPVEGKELMDFRVVPDEAIAVIARQAFTVDWRAERFSDPERIRVGPGGHVKRRTVLMEAPEPESPTAPAGPALESLSPETLRQLADLEDQRRRGELTEAQYQTRRREILAADPGAR